MRDLVTFTILGITTGAIYAVAASGLTLALGFRERRRTFAIAAALGARPRQLGGFIWASRCSSPAAG